MRSSVVLALRTLLAVGLPVVALMTACNGTVESKPPAPSTPVQAPGVQGRNDDTPSTSSTNTISGCEDLGSLAGSSLKATLGDDIETISLPLANRPVPSRLAVVVVGSGANVVGKTVALGAAENANYRTCTRCLVIALGCGADCSNAAWFFPRSGTATVTAAATKEGDPFGGKFEDVVLEEIKIDAATGTSTPVSGGACLHIQQLSFEAKAGSGAASTDAGPTDASAPDADAGSSGTGTSGGTGKGGGGADSIKKDPFGETS